MAAIQNWTFYRCEKSSQTNFNSASGGDMGNSRPINTRSNLLVSFLHYRALFHCRLDCNRRNDSQSVQFGFQKWIFDESIKRAIPIETYLNNDILDLSHIYRVPYRSNDWNFRKLRSSHYFWCTDYVATYDGNFLLFTFSVGGRSWDDPMPVRI